jgi:hypothetical protein
LSVSTFRKIRYLHGIAIEREITLQGNRCLTQRQISDLSSSFGIDVVVKQMLWAGLLVCIGKVRTAVKYFGWQISWEQTKAQPEG